MITLSIVYLIVQYMCRDSAIDRIMLRPRDIYRIVISISPEIMFNTLNDVFQD